MEGPNSKGKGKRPRVLPDDELDDEQKEERKRSRQRIPLTNEDRIDWAKSDLRDHIGVVAGKERHPRNPVLFFIELAPYSNRGAACQHVTCKDHIEAGSYRIAVKPGMNLYKNPDFYHVRCFEELVDFSQAAYLDRIIPVTRNYVSVRGLSGISILDGNNFLDGGAERLVLEWKWSMRKLMDRRDEVPITTEPDLDNLHRKAGSASYEFKPINGMPDHEFFTLSIMLAPIESDGVDDQDEWNLFERYLPRDFNNIEDFKKPHSLSDILSVWKSDKFLACANEDRLTDKAKEEKDKLGEKAIRAIRRLSAVPMPDIQSAFRS
ncbi:hypothetical protein BU16DRAFT_359308 [Lophium mytilinum]|uniref:PARP-type domain-containing protein n=1 Tax=Lophium mytilinum TaxID=390894 RepID=A0A6A6QUS8_9PEZI|nr:hypothetical protein BU16DRAFT_359308 [Lophium mytilinum]